MKAKTHIISFIAGFATCAVITTATLHFSPDLSLLSLGKSSSAENSTSPIKKNKAKDILASQYGINDVTARLGNGDTPLHTAANNNNCQLIELLLDAGAPIELVSGDGLTPLQYAFYEGSLDAARLLLKRGAKINSPVDFPCLAQAMFSSKTEAVRLAIDAGADLHFKKLEEILNRQNGIVGAERFKPLINHALNVEEYFITMSNDMEKDDMKAFAVGDVTYESSAPESLELEINGRFVDSSLNENHDKETIKCKQSIFDELVNGETLLMQAAKAGKVKYVRYMLSKGADATIETVTGETALSLAEKNKKIKCAALLKEALKKKK